jgi:hypothetical protein
MAAPCPKRESSTRICGLDSNVDEIEELLARAAKRPAA